MGWLSCREVLYIGGGSEREKMEARAEPAQDCGRLVQARWHLTRVDFLSLPILPLSSAGDVGGAACLFRVSFKESPVLPL